MRTMKAIVVHAPGDIRFEEIVLPALGPDQVCVRVATCGVCASDVPRALGGKAYFYPIVLGHEIAGAVVEVGAEVKGIFIGQRCAVAPLIPCGRCEWCASGRYSLCDDYDYLGSRTTGGNAEYVVAPAANIVLLPDSVSDEAGALLEPAAVALHGLGFAHLKPGEAVAVIGAGPLGLLALQLAQILEANRVWAIDVLEAKLQVARSLGAETLLEDGQGAAVRNLRDVTHGRGVDVVIEASGATSAFPLALRLVRKGGRIVRLGLSEDDLVLSRALNQRITREELTVMGAWNSYSAPFPGQEWQVTLAYMSTGQLQTRPLMTHRFPLDQARHAWQMMWARAEFFNKVVLIP